MSIKTTSNKLPPYTLDFSKQFNLPQDLVQEIKNKYIQKTLDQNTSLSSGNICCTDYNAWIDFYPRAEDFNTRLFHPLNNNTELFYINKKVIQMKINKEFYIRHGFPNKEDKDEA